MSTDRSLSMDTSLPHSATECARDVSVTHESDRTREATGTVSVKEGCEKSSVDGGPSTAQVICVCVLYSVLLSLFFATNVGFQFYYIHSNQAGQRECQNLWIPFISHLSLSQ